MFSTKPPKGLGAKLYKDSYEIPKIFEVMQNRAQITYEKMCNTFNMGIGMVLAVPAGTEQAVIDFANSIGEEAVMLGEVVKGEGVAI